VSVASDGLRAGDERIATPDSINNLDAVEEVFFIGYPDGLYVFP
jgi:hypothetical protein